MLELHERKWVAHKAIASTTGTIVQIHENVIIFNLCRYFGSLNRIYIQVAKEKAPQEKESYQRQISMSQGGRAVAWGGSGPPGPPPVIYQTLGSVFVGTKDAEDEREAISPTNSEPLQQRKHLVLQPRLVPVEVTSPATESENNHSEEEASVEMTEEAALKKIGEDMKEFFAIRNLEEAEVYFSSLPPQHHHVLVDKIVSTAVESKEDDAKLVSQLFDLASSKELCSSASFEQGLTPVAEIIDDIAIDAPKAFQLLAIMVKAAGLNQEQLSNLASKSLNSDKFLVLVQ